MSTREGLSLFYKFPWEYWHSKILYYIARGIDIPLRLDKATSDDDFGHHARVLVELDVSVKLIGNLMIDRVDKSFFIEITYKSLLAFLIYMLFYGSCAKCLQIK